LMKGIGIGVGFGKQRRFVSHDGRLSESLPLAVLREI
jgi:hypothetical protein